MGIPGAANPLLAAAAGAAAAGASPTRALRIDNTNSGYLTRTAGAGGSSRKWTFNCWWKFSGAGLGTSGMIFGCRPSNTNDTTFAVRYETDGTFKMTTEAELLFQTTQVFRDPGAWQMLTFVLDTGNGTSGDRFKMFVNGTRITEWSTAATITQDRDLGWNKNAEMNIGRLSSLGYYADMYLANIHFINDAVLAPSDFSETDSDTGQLIPKDYTGSYGTNGFHLEFDDNSSNTATTIGKDTSGNSNNWTPVNISVSDGGPTSVAAATGGQPIWDTSDTYGGTISSGYETDASSSNLYLAIPMNGSNNGTTFTDESNHINGSSTEKTVTASDQMKTKTDQSHFYGSSGYLPPASSDTNVSGYLTIDGHSELAIGTGSFTIEFWYRPGPTPGSNNCLFDWREPGFLLRHSDNDTLQLHGSPAAGQLWSLAYISVMRGQWQHIAISRNGSNLMVFTDGRKVVDITSTINQPQDDLEINKFGDTDDLGVGGHMQDFRIYVGAAKYTADFSPPRSTRSPDVSIQNDSVRDTPTDSDTSDDTGAGGEVSGNYATWNCLVPGKTYRNGNLDCIVPGNTDDPAIGTLGVTSGKWYFELIYTGGADGVCVGVTKNEGITSMPGNNDDSWAYMSYSGKKNHNSTQTSYGTAFTPTAASGHGTTVGCALDIDNRKIWWAINGTWQASGNPATGANAAFTDLDENVTYFITCGIDSGGANTSEFSLNAGQRAFTYTAPSGFKPWSTAFISAPTIAKPNEHFDVVLYTGDGGTKTISGLEFQPDMVWSKYRGSVAGVSHIIYDAVRTAGPDKGINTDLIRAMGTCYDGSTGTRYGHISAFTSDGYTVVNGNQSTSYVNHLNHAYVGWAWKAATTASGTWGANSKTYSRRTNATAGFSIIRFTADGTTGLPGTGSIPHGLGGTPDIVISKRLDGNGNWWTGFTCFDGSFDVLKLESDGSKSDETYDIYDDDEISNWGCPDGSDQMYYAFKSIPGFSKIGKYVGNNNNNGVHVNCDFAPRFLIIKCIDSSGNWAINDTERDDNTAWGNDASLYANTNGAETTSASLNVDFLSNGFKLRSNNASYNGTSSYLCLAFAEKPYKYARAI